MLQYKIPQNVQLEDKIVSFLTIRQLIICSVGGGIAYILYITLAPNYYGEVWMPPVFTISAITLAIAFVKVNDIPFIKWVLLLIEFFAKPRKRIWDKSANTNLLFAFVTSKRSTEAEHQKIKEEKNNIENQKNFSALEEITKKLDQNPFSDIERKIDRTDDSDDQRLAHSALMSEEDIATHEKRIAAVIAMQKRRKENQSPEEVTIETQDLRPQTIGVFEKKENQVPEAQTLEEIKTEEDPVKSEAIKADDDSSDSDKEDLIQVIVKKETAQPQNLSNFHKEESPKLSTENIISNTKEISKDDFLRNKKKKLLRRAFPLPSFKEEIVNNNEEDVSAPVNQPRPNQEIVSSNVEKTNPINSQPIINRVVVSNNEEKNITSAQPRPNQEVVSSNVEKTNPINSQTIINRVVVSNNEGANIANSQPRPNQEIISSNVEKSSIINSQPIQPKRFTPVREKTNVDTSKKPVIPKEHEILLSQIKEGEIQINFSDNNE